MSADVYIDKGIQAIRDLHSDIISRRCELTIAEFLQSQADRLVETHEKGDKSIVFHVRCWHPTLVGRPVEEIMSRTLSNGDARATLAREYGYSDWDAVLNSEERSSDPLFETAVDLLLAGQVAELSKMLEEQPQLISQRSAYGHKATLLHYVGSNGLETDRQVVPMNLREVAQLLIAAGADVNAIANIYGGSAVLGLLTSSAHPAKAGVVDDVAAVLAEAGAK